MGSKPRSPRDTLTRRRLTPAEWEASRAAFLRRMEEKGLLKREALYGVDAVLKRIREEYDRAKSNWPPFNSAHEGLAVLEEEVHELKLHVYTNQKRRDLRKMQAEAVQVAAMALRFATEVCDDERGRK